MIQYLKNLWAAIRGKSAIKVNPRPLSGSGDQPPNPPTGGK